MRRLWIIVIALTAVISIVGLAFAASTLLPDNPIGTATATAERTDAAASPEVIDDDLLGTVEVYLVDDAAKLHPAPASDSLTAIVWDTFVRIASVEFVATMVDEFHVGDAPDVDNAASVLLMDNTDRWILSANLAVSEVRGDLMVTLVHEFGHILTLQSRQMSTTTGPCTTLELEEGCLADDATMWVFHQQFWVPYGDTAPAHDNQDWDLGRAFFDEHEGDFVSDYAASTVVEDIAESFMAFVLENRPRGDSIAAQKLEFFWQVPEYVEIRERIRAEFADELGLVP